MALQALAHLREQQSSALAYFDSFFVFAALGVVLAFAVLRMKRSVSLLVSDRQGPQGKIVEGTYQSPILVQWQRAPRESRTLDVTLTSLS